jgi:hypothetical protein
VLHSEYYVCATPDTQLASRELLLNAPMQEGGTVLQ